MDLLSDDEEFSFNLSSFVEASREVTLHMQKQYSKKEDFENWYKTKVSEMKQNPTLRFLIKVRDYSTKEGPIPTGVTRKIGLGMSMLLVNEGENPVKNTKEPAVLEPPSSQTVSRWFWDVSEYLDKGDKVHVQEFEKGDVLKTCEIIIEYLVKLVDECEANFS